MTKFHKPTININKIINKNQKVPSQLWLNS